MAKAKKLPSGMWRTLVYDYTDSDGKRHYESFTAEGKKESEYLAAEFSLKKKNMRKTSNLTLRQAIDKYISDSDGVLSPSTINGYNIIKEQAFKDIIDIPLKKLTNDILKKAVNIESKRKSNSTRCKGQTISPKTVSNEYGLIASVIHLYEPNLNINVKLPSKVNNAVTKEIIEPEVILNVIKGTKIELACLLSMWLSFSMSELKGLTKSKSVKGDYIVIAEVVITVCGDEIRKTQAKQYTRNRKHKIPPYIKSLINQVDGDVLVPMSGHAIYMQFTRLLKKNNLPHMTFHDLRHVNASVMAMLNVPEKYAMERGGWKTDSVMKKVYTHTFPKERVTVDNLIDDYFESKMQHEMQHKIKKSQ